MAVAAAYEHAARLSTDKEGKARRIVNAARAAYDAGRPMWANRLATEAVSSTNEPRLAAEATFIRAQVEYEATSPAADAALALEVIRSLNCLERLELSADSRLRPLVSGLIGWGRLFAGKPDSAVPLMRSLIGAAPTGMPWWRDGLQLGVLAVATTTFATTVQLVRLSDRSGPSARSC
ncbi:hypothetical protein GCM10022224_080670 [Nonomuraea antimicrobica]|uniref:Tetratricopeptide repeat-containing protein n=1 Tax=Nonomuraea antimicrobica TaxID=561173 RepID=A0ABP7DA10_9ACTN